jgi:protein gp37
MSDKSAIEWTEATWNPTTGCDRVSAGCDNCYALTLAKRLKAMGNPKYQNYTPRCFEHPVLVEAPTRCLRELDERPVSRTRAI